MRPGTAEPTDETPDWAARREPTSREFTARLSAMWPSSQKCGRIDQRGAWTYVGTPSTARRGAMSDSISSLAFMGSASLTRHPTDQAPLAAPQGAQRSLSPGNARFA